MIKWALHLRMLSSASYHAFRTAGFLHLPTERTLRDYIHAYPSKVGFCRETNRQLMIEAKVDTLTDIHRHVVLLFDEMKIREDIVYDKNTGTVIGVVDLAGVNNSLKVLESRLTSNNSSQLPEGVEVATHMLAIMVRGLVTELKFPYAHFTTTSITAHFLNDVLWEAVRNLEACGFSVIAVTCDGAASNRRLFGCNGIKQTTRFRHIAL